MFKLFAKKELKTINREIIDKEISEFNSWGLAQDDNNVIVSLTSFPQRINEIKYTLYSILNQTYKPSKVILWLAADEFPNLEKDIPQEVLNLKNNGLTIEWTDNIYSYKKLVPSLEKYPDKITVTADDDVYYEQDWLEKLVRAYEKEKCIVCHRAHRIKISKNGLEPYKKWAKKIKGGHASYLNFFTGVGGVLYPPPPPCFKYATEACLCGLPLMVMIFGFGLWQF